MIKRLVSRQFLFISDQRPTQLTILAGNATNLSKTLLNLQNQAAVRVFNKLERGSRVFVFAIALGNSKGREFVFLPMQWHQFAPVDRVRIRARLLD